MHALFRQVLYEHTAAAVRADLHRKVGTALESERRAGVPVTAAELAMHFERGHEPMRALRYYAEAAEAALMNLSPDECMDLTGLALDLLQQANKGGERDALEIDLGTLRGLAAFHLHGVGSEAKDSFQRAYALLADLPEHPRRGLLLHNFGFLLGLRADYGEALALADRAQALASASADPVLRLAACTVQAEAHLLQGRPGAGRKLVESVLPALESVDVGPAHSFAQVTLLGLLGIHLVHLGLIQQASARLEQAYARAERIGQPMGTMVAIWCDALVQVRLGDADRVSKLANAMQTLVDETQLGQGRAAGRWFKGWAEARKGEAQAGFRQIRDGFEQNTRAGMLAGGSEVLGYAAEALLLAGDHDGAQGQLEQAFQIADKHGERVYLPQLLLLQGAVARARGEPEAAACRGPARRCGGARPGSALARTACPGGIARTRRCEGPGPRGVGGTRRQSSRGARHASRREGAGAAVEHTAERRKQTERLTPRAKRDRDVVRSLVSELGGSLLDRRSDGFGQVLRQQHRRVPRGDVVQTVRHGMIARVNDHLLDPAD